MRWLRLISNADHRRTAFILSAVVLVGLLIGPAASAAGNVVVNLVANSIFLIVNNLLMGMIKLFASLTGIFISLLVIVARYNTFLNAPIVTQGWPIVRDLMNMMFIIGLLLISAGTVLRLQNYRYNRLLGKLILMAFLVNFSKFIAVFLLQFAQIVMLTFVNAFRDVAFGNFTHMFGLDAVLNFSQSFERSGGTSLGIFVTLLAGLAMMLVAFVVMLAITIMLFIRIIALWLLIILSPIAYALRILPNTERYASQWWAEFTKYAVLGPVLAFFLWISLALVGGGNCAGKDCNSNPLRTGPEISTQLDSANIDTKDLRSDFVSELLSLDRLITFVVGIIFLMMGLQYAQKSGAAGASFAGKVATAGFGTAATLTGLNAIRDRTLAPVQGWIANRGRARQNAIQQRTESLEAAGDRVKARYGLTERARERGAAANAAYDRNRTARLAQQQGMKDMHEDGLMGKMIASGDQRERVAAMQELQNRGRLNLADPGQRTAFETLTNLRRRGITGQRTGPTYMPQADQRKFREDVLKSSVDHLNPEQIRDIIHNSAQTPEEIDILTRAVEQKKDLDPNETADRELVDVTRAALADLPARLKQFDDALKKSNPEMAMRTIYRGLGERAADPARGLGRVDALHETEEDIAHYVADVQQGLISTRGLTPELQAQVATRLEGLGTSREYAQNHIARDLVHGSRTREDMDRTLNGMSEESLNSLLEGSRLDYRDAQGNVHTMDDEKRKSLAERHLYGEAFGRMDAGGVYHDGEGADAATVGGAAVLNEVRQYAVQNDLKIKAGYSAQKISNGTLLNRNLMDIFDGLDEIGEDEAKALTKNIQKRGLYTRTKLDPVSELQRAGADFDPANEAGRRNLKQLRMFEVASRGGSVRTVDGSRLNAEFGDTVDPMVFAYGRHPVNVTPGAIAANPNIETQLRDAGDQYVRTNGSNLTRINYPALARGPGTPGHDPATYNPEIARMVRENINVRDLTSIHDSNTHSVIAIIQDLRTRYNALEGALATTLTKDERRAARNANGEHRRLDTMFNAENGRLRSNDTLSAY